MSEQVPDPESVAVTHHGADAEFRFVDGVRVRQPGTMVYLDFFQTAGRDVAQTRGSARLVMLPSVLDSLIEQLSALRAAQP
jgi:hypothetical protein